jgi:hypothetical protein
LSITTLQALGTLFIVWTLSSLIAAEINYVQTGVFHVVVFIEVAMITLLRQEDAFSRYRKQLNFMASDQDKSETQRMLFMKADQNKFRERFAELLHP